MNTFIAPFPLTNRQPYHRVAVVLLTWKRPDALGRTLATLKSQDISGFDIYLWNNNTSISSQVDLTISLSCMNVHVIHSETNEGCIARHRLAFSLKNTYSHFIFIDDDQEFDSDCLSTLLSESTPDSLVGWWAWNLGSRYWVRSRAKPGHRVNYLGCGMIIVPSGFYDQDFFSVPDHFMCLDDLWCSIYAQIKKYDLRASSVNVVMKGDDDVALYLPLYSLKQEFLEWARQAYGLPRISHWVDFRYAVSSSINRFRGSI